MDADIRSDIDAIRLCVDSAFGDLIDQALLGLSLCERDSPDRPATKAAFTAILEACSAQDLIGQRLDRIATRLAGVRETRPEADLLNGPVNVDPPDQAAIDALFGDDGRAS